MKNRQQQDSFAGERYIPARFAKITSIGSLPLFGMLLFATAVLSNSVDCKCQHANKETTQWGGNEAIVVIEEKTYRTLDGTVEIFDGRPVENALVEVFDHPDYLLDRSSSNFKKHPKQKRLASCRTASDGTFCFRQFASGTYELRTSVGSGWNVTHVRVVVDKKAGQNKTLKVQMSLGT